MERERKRERTEREGRGRKTETIQRQKEERNRGRRPKCVGIGMHHRGDGHHACTMAKSLRSDRHSPLNCLPHRRAGATHLDLRQGEGLDKCLRRDLDEWWSVEQPLKHPFMAPSVNCLSNMNSTHKWISQEHSRSGLGINIIRRRRRRGG